MASQRSLGPRVETFMAGHHATAPRLCNTVLACDLTLPRGSREGSLASSRVNLVDGQVGSCAGARFGTLTSILAVSTRAKTPYPREAGNERFIQRWTPPSSPTRDQRDAGRLQRTRCPTSLSQEHPSPVHYATSHYAAWCTTLLCIG
jgi:hypothetical protein